MNALAEEFRKAISEWGGGLDSKQIEDLSGYLAESNLPNLVYAIMEREYVKEDVDYLLDEFYMDPRCEKLTEEQRYKIADQVRVSEDYCSIDLKTISECVKEILKEEADG